MLIILPLTAFLACSSHRSPDKPPAPAPAAPAPDASPAGSTWLFREYRAGREAPQSTLSSYTLRRSGGRATLTIDEQRCEPAFGGQYTGGWRLESHQVLEGRAVQLEEVVELDFNMSGQHWVLQCRPKTVIATRADAVRVRILPSEGTNFGRWEPRAALSVDALSCDDPKLAQEDALVFASLPGLERVWADAGCPEDAKPAERKQCDSSPSRLRVVAAGGAIAPARADQ